MKAMKALLITNNQADRFGRNDLLAAELVPAFSGLGVDLLRADYISEPRNVLDALQNPDIEFFVCFDGFGTELQSATTRNLNQLDSVFDAFGKPIYDIMRNCPAHDWMAHQSGPVPRRRRMLVTDYSYAAMAEELGATTPRFVSSFTYPASLFGQPRPIPERGVDILLPISLAPPELFSDRYQLGAAAGGRIKRAIFDEATEISLSDWSLDPNGQVIASCRRAGMPFSLSHEADRFLLTSVENFVKCERRRRIFAAVSHLPLTVITNRPIDSPGGSSMKLMESLSALEMLKTMANSKIVVCPTPHRNGFDECFMSAFTAGAAVVAAPNTILETQFVHNRDFVNFRSEVDLVDLLERLIKNETRLERIADSGRRRALSLFPSSRLAETVLSIHALENPLAREARP